MSEAAKTAVQDFTGRLARVPRAEGAQSSLKGESRYFRWHALSLPHCLIVDGRQNLPHGGEHELRVSASPRESFSQLKLALVVRVCVVLGADWPAAFTATIW